MPQTAAQEPSTVAALDRSNVARYIQLASLFRRRIASGEWPVAEKIPNVEILAKQCGVANMTIRQALNLLEEEGLIARFRAKGTFVIRQPTRDLWCDVKTDLSGMLLARPGATIELLREERGVPLPWREIEIGRPAAAYRHFRRRHDRGGEAFLLADIHLEEGLAAKLAPGDVTEKTAMRLLSDIPGVVIANARQILTIDAADLEVSDLMGIPLSAPVANVRRLFVAPSGELMMVADGIYRGDQVRIEMNLK